MIKEFQILERQVPSPIIKFIINPLCFASKNDENQFNENFKILFISCVLPLALFLSTVSAQELRTYPIPQRSEQEFNELLISAQKEVRGLEELAWEHFFGINIPISVDEAMKIVNLPSLQNSAQALTIKGGFSYTCLITRMKKKESKHLKKLSR